MRNFLAFSVLVGTLFLTSCGSEDQPINRQGLQQKISATENHLLLQDGTLISDSAQKLIDLYSSYSDNFPVDSNADKYLFKAIDISLKLSQTQKALQLIENFLSLYPMDSKAGTVLFFKAFLHDQQLGDFEGAKQYYELFLAKYPEHEFADDAQAALRHLGKSPEDLIKEFEANQ